MNHEAKVKVMSAGDFIFRSQEANAAVHPRRVSPRLPEGVGDWVARNFAASRRRDRLSFQHHAELASLPEHEQDCWLEQSRRFGWSRNELRRQVLTRRVIGAPPASTDVDGPLRIGEGNCENLCRLHLTSVVMPGGMR